MHAYERFMLHRYLANLLSSRRFLLPVAADTYLQEWLTGVAKRIGLPPLHLPPQSHRGIGKVPEAWNNWRLAVIACAAKPAPRISPLQKRVDWLAKACRLNASQTFLLGLFMRLAMDEKFREFIAALRGEAFRQYSYFEASYLKPLFDSSVTADDLKPKNLLWQLGLLISEDDRRFKASEIAISVARCKRLNSRELVRVLLGAPASATLSWEDFDHLGEMRDLAVRLISSVGKQGSKGTNILLHGPPGTGKSEFAKTLGARVGADVRFVGESDERDNEPERLERIAALMFANTIGILATRLIVVVDEADDLFAGVDEANASTRQGSKVFMNRLVETTKVPTIWITNELSRLGPAVVRRMNLVLHFPKPGLLVRRKMVARIARRTGFALSDEEVKKIAQLQAAPALIENALMSAARINGTPLDALNILRSGIKILGGDKRPLAPAPIAFDPVLSSAEVNLLELADRVAKTATKALSFCLSGPPGTGKSAFAGYLAERLDMEILDKRYSDLASAYLGQTEKAIASAFEEAADLRAFLILDEADSLLRDRGAARHSWEVTQVNEMLCAMEHHPYPFACTTNAPDLLDQATLRRFLFKVRFLPMNEKQIALAFRRAFSADAPQSVLKLDLLTPGDFAVVARKASVLGERRIEQIAKWLNDEVGAKPEGRKVRIGF
jgi:transitional endoplasmic reticulum ATPase